MNEMSGYSYPEGGPPADLLVEGHGITLDEAISNVGLAMFNSITPLDGINEKENFVIDADGIDEMSLLFNLLDEMLYLNDVEGLVAKKIKVNFDTSKLKARAECIGERFTALTHKAGIAVKAVTYHMMEIKKVKDAWIVRVVFDT
ncbi:archease [Candidatus Bathyarchaeota archaeon]|nr:archease [Candidatus Bathyarchaeota archaeon]